jgi:peptidoglycan/LPS O-acetylase OafA/YrhL
MPAPSNSPESRATASWVWSLLALASLLAVVVSPFIDYRWAGIPPYSAIFVMAGAICLWMARRRQGHGLNRLLAALLIYFGIAALVYALALSLARSGHPATSDFITTGAIALSMGVGVWVFSAKRPGKK